MDLHLNAYNALKYLHIFLAILAVGFNASYSIWLARAGKDPVHLPYTLRGIKTLDDRFANPAYALLLVTGILTALAGNIPFTIFWIAAAIALWVVMVLVGLLLYTPTLRRQIQVLEAQGADSAEYRALDRRGARLGIFLAILVAVIIFLMVFKPA